MISPVAYEVSDEAISAVGYGFASGVDAAEEATLELMPTHCSTLGRLSLSRLAAVNALPHDLIPEVPDL